MSKKKKDKDKKHKHAAEAAAADGHTEVEKLRQEVEELRARLERIAELASTPIPSAQLEPDEEDAEYEELSKDVDDQIAEMPAEPAKV